jgi:GT2 family glycosyltransferase
MECRIDDIELYMVIVDNNSINEEKEKLIKWNDDSGYKNVDYFFLEENIGYFPAINYGLLNCNKTDVADYVIIGNNDLIFNGDFLHILSQKKYTNEVFIIAPDIINKGNNHQNPHVAYKYSKLQLIYLELYHFNYCIAHLIDIISSIFHFRGMQKSKDGYEIPQFISIGYGACYILTKQYIKNIKVVPTYLFLMNEENALSDEVFKHGGRIFYDPDLIVYHIENTSVKKILSRNMYKIMQESYKISKKHFNNAFLYDRNILL